MLRVNKYIVGFMIWVVGTLTFFSLKSPVVRDLIIVLVAEHRAGDPVLVDSERVGPTGQLMMTTDLMVTNSPWLAEETYRIVPFFSYEGLVGQGIYPQVIVWGPRADYASLHVLGSASCESRAIAMNQRSLVKGSRDMRQIYSTLVHELIHLQQGNFCTGLSEDLESATQAATLEVLAGMCRYQNELACGAFWEHLADLARSSLRARVGDRVYLMLTPLFYGYDDRVSLAKSLGFWEPRRLELQTIIQKYGQAPWNDHVIPGTQGKDLDTGNVTWAKPGTFIQSPPTGVVLGMPFDDTRALLGWMNILMWE